VRDVLAEPGERAFSLFALGDRHDVRPLVLPTALTYLELAGVVRQGTPFYAGYKVRLLRPKDELLAAFSGEPRAFLGRFLAAGKKGRTWITVDADAVAEAIGAERSRVVRALEVCEERGLVELVASELPHRF